MEKKKRKQIPHDKRLKILLWSQRHCCLCGKQCRTKIEIHHIDGDPSNNDIDNLIPCCFDCHSEMSLMDFKQPRGNKLRINEIKITRNQYYRKYMSDFIRPIFIHIKKGSEKHTIKNGRMDVRCIVSNNSNDMPLKIRMKIMIYNGRGRKINNLGDVYKGRELINLNPNQSVDGHFKFNFSDIKKNFPYRIEIFWRIINIYDYEYEMLPYSYVLSELRYNYRETKPQESVWYFDPKVLKDINGRKRRTT